jgi:hypothetical protein
MLPRAGWMCAATLGLVACGGGGGGADDTGDADTGDDAPDADVSNLDNFSFFVTSLAVLQDLSGSPDGFGGDLRFGETGPGAGLRGADKLCATIADRSMPGAAGKGWRAFLSAADDGNGTQVNAIERIGTGPWYDRTGRLLAPTLADLMHTRPQNGDPTIADDFPNEDGVPNHQPDPLQPEVDNHDMLTGTDDTGQLYAANATCLDWTAKAGDIPLEGRPASGTRGPAASAEEEAAAAAAAAAATSTRGCRRSPSRAARRA